MAKTSKSQETKFEVVAELDAAVLKLSTIFYGIPSDESFVYYTIIVYILHDTLSQQIIHLYYIVPC